MRALIVAIVVFAFAGHAHADRATEDTQLAFAARSESAEEIEKQALGLATTTRAWRSDAVLSLVTARGQLLRFEDRDGCDSDASFDGCRFYRLIAHLPSRHVFIVVVLLYESGVYLLVDDRTGRETLIPQFGLPRFGPDEDRFVVVDSSPHYSAGPVVQVWRRVDDTAEVEWAHMFTPSFGTAGPLPDWIEFVRWEETTGILLEMTRYAGLNAPDQNWRSLLWRGDDGWHLRPLLE